MNTYFRPRSPQILLVVILFLALLAGSTTKALNHSAYPLPEDRGTAGILGALERLPVFVRVLHTVAHPDDESAATLSWLARGAHARTALFSLTRGDGGQNVLGDEKYEAMGLVRTGELLEASRIYGVETYFSTVFEFGFSKSAEETLSKWGHEATLEELVHFIRMWKPDIIISKWLGTSRDGHGHHQAAGILTHEAFRAAADPERFPEHFKQGLRPWQAKKFYRNNIRGEPGPAREDDPGGSGLDWTIRLNVGAYDPVLGRSFREIGSEGYSKHRSQGNAASYSLGGRAFDYYKRVDSAGHAPKIEESFFDTLDTTLKAIAELAGDSAPALPFLRSDLEGVQAAAEQALRSFRPRQPEASASHAVKGFALITDLSRKVEASTAASHVKTSLQEALQQKKTDFQDAANAALGIYVAARTEEATATPGEKIPVTVHFFNRGSERVDLKRVTLWAPEGWVSSLPAGAPLGEIPPGGQVSLRHTVEIPENARPTQPFWYRESREETRYRTRPTRNVFAPFDPPEITAQATYRFQNTDVSIFSPATAAVGDPIRGMDIREFQVVPALSVGLSPEFVIAPISSTSETREFQVSVLCNNKAGATGELRIEPPAGWRVEPARLKFKLSRKGESFSSRVSLRIPGGTRAGSFPLEAVAEYEGKQFKSGYRIISYPENWTRHLYSPSRAEVKTFDVRVAPNLTVGYVPGAGDEVPAALEQLGVKVQMLSDTDLAFGNLDRFGAIVTGIRAYNVNEDLKANNQRLLQYVENGGTLIVQYNTASRGPNSSFPYAPYPMRSSAGDRVTVEESPVTILVPGSPIFQIPNKITAADFDGWVQERGLYFMSDWDSRYTALLSGNDPGEPPKHGGMLMTRYGKGYYIFTAYAWFRQLPAGVPGAFRIFANLLSVGKSGTGEDAK